MKIELKIDKGIEENKIVIYAKELNDSISNLVNKLEKLESIEDNIILIGFSNNMTFILNKSEIETIYSEGNKVYARIDDKIYRMKKKLYELEEILQGTSFVRISNSEIANFDKVESMEINGSSLIILKYKSGQISYVSRRYVKKIKDYLKI